MSAFEPITIGIVSVSDRASTGVYEDKGLPALKEWLARALHNPITFESRLIPDEQATISQALIELVNAGCSLVLTTGGTGPAMRDVTPAGEEASHGLTYTRYTFTMDGLAFARYSRDQMQQAMRARGISL